MGTPKKVKLTLHFVFLTLFISGCFQGGLKRRFPKPPQVPLPLPQKLYDYAGVIHVHSHYSRDSRGTVSEIQHAAELSGCDFVMTTDHNSLALKQKREGKHGKVLWIVGTELSLRGGHILTFGLSHLPDRRLFRDPPKILQYIHKKQGLAFVAHPFGDKNPWKGPDKGFVGIEVFNLGTVAKRSSWSLLAGALLTLYPLDRAGTVSLFLKRPHEEWRFFDKLSQKQYLVPIAGVDAHAIPLPWGGKLTIYDHLFPIVRLHVLASRLTVKAIFEAIRQGRVYVSFDLFSDATSFLFYAQHTSERNVHLMGSTLPWKKGWELYAKAPEIGEFHFYRNGALVWKGRGQKVSYRPLKKGVYRVEVLKKMRGRLVPWIYSAPIWLGQKI